MVGLIEKTCANVIHACIIKHYSKEKGKPVANAPVSKRIYSQLAVKGLIKEKSFFTVVWIIYRTTCAIFTR